MIDLMRKSLQPVGLVALAFSTLAPIDAFSQTGASSPVGDPDARPLVSLHLPTCAFELESSFTFSVGAGHVDPMSPRVRVLLDGVDVTSVVTVSTLDAPRIVDADQDGMAELYHAEYAVAWNEIDPIVGQVVEVMAEFASAIGPVADQGTLDVVTFGSPGAGHVQ